MWNRCCIVYSSRFVTILFILCACARYVMDIVTIRADSNIRLPLTKIIVSVPLFSSRFSARICFIVRKYRRIGHALDRPVDDVRSRFSYPSYYTMTISLSPNLQSLHNSSAICVNGLSPLMSKHAPAPPPFSVTQSFVTQYRKPAT